jgi:predicted RNA-binding Zn-ribbon protein involved in translation (DUF1610 family)
VTPRVLFFDLETSPNLSHTWGIYEQNVISVERHWMLITGGYRWSEQPKAKAVNLVDFDPKGMENGDDGELVKFLWTLLDEADIVIGHNGDKFDIRKANARFAYHGLGPTSPFKTVDTLKVARRYFNFNSNRLNDLGQHLGLGKKVETGGFGLWLGCLKGDKKSWALMAKYCRQDVDLLVEVYERLRPWMKTHPNMGVGQGGFTCPNCGSLKVQRRGTARTQVNVYQRWQCKDCGSYSRSRKAEKEKAVEKPELVPGA